jgi:hypothetical protein
MNSLLQTDDYVESLTGLVKQHQQTEKKRKRDERNEAKQVLRQQEGLHRKQNINCRIFVKISENGNGESDEAPISIVVRNSATGEILRGEAAPKPDEVDDFIANNPGFELISRDMVSDSDDEPDDEVETHAEPDEKDDDEFEGTHLR